MIHAARLVATLLVGLAGCAVGFPVVSRNATVHPKLYAFNHDVALKYSAYGASEELSMKMSKMGSSPFYFYRGTAHLFYDDMASPAWGASAFYSDSTNYTLLLGDAHLANFGTFENANSDIVFDWADFDETYQGSYLWDVRRLATSIVLGAGETGLAAADVNATVKNLADWYLNKLGDFKGTSAELGYVLKSGDTSGYVNNLIAKAGANTRSDLLSKYTASGKFVTNNVNLTTITSALYTSVVAAVQPASSMYRSNLGSSASTADSYYKVKDVRRKKFSGTGSLGRLRLYVLIDGPSTSNSDDRILEVKMETSSAVARAAPGRTPPSAYMSHEGRRAVLGYKAMLTSVDPLVGHTTVDGYPCYAHEKIPKGEDFDHTQLTSASKWLAASEYIGKIAARSHA